MEVEVEAALPEASQASESEWLCAVCGEDSTEAPIVFCDKCDTGVHPACYGAPLINHIPDGAWECERCKWDAQGEACILCPFTDGVMKRTTDYRWAHLSCSMWIPEVFYRFGESRDPIDCTRIPRRRWGQRCTFCHLDDGCCMECSQQGCQKTFHITCGLQKSISLEYKENDRGADVIIAMCAPHARRWQQQAKKNKNK